MAKKSFLLMTLMMAMLLLSSVRVSAASTPIPLTGEYIDPHKGQLGGHRSQTIVPELEIDDYTLFFVQTTGWKPGVYVVRASIGGQSFSEKIVVK